MSRLDTDQADRDELTRRRLERDAEREPRQHRHPRCVAPVARQVFQASVIDSANRSKALQLMCVRPGCLGPVFVPADSDRERVTCAACITTLITRRALDGSVSLQETDHAPE